ncbi:MAG: hypothetical protein IT331_00060 [Anaerolineae bacterium]|nr:hypothetical protein [Anaerolineae bacterium]
MSETPVGFPFRLAVIGPDDLVDQVVSIGQEFPHLRFSRYPYEIETEAPVLADQAALQADLILFTGAAPFYWTKISGNPNIPFLFVPLTGSSFLRTLFVVREEHRFRPGKLSIDTPNLNLALETLNELGLSADDVYVKELSIPAKADDLAAFHTSLWKEGKIYAAITCLRSVYLRLKTDGLPVFRVLVTNSAIRTTLKLAQAQAEQLRYKGTQIAVQICEIDNFDDPIKRSNSGYEGKRVRLALQRVLNDYSERIWASVPSTGGPQFTIYTTRGILEATTDFFQCDPLLEEIRREMSVTVSIGTGLGPTAFHAEANARQTVERAKAAGGNCSFVMTDDGRLIGPLEGHPSLEAVITERDSGLTESAKRAGMSIETLSRIMSLLQSLGRETITAVELAQALRIAPRGARRMLLRLEQARMAQVFGEEQPLPSGRPRRVYRVHLL